MSEEIRRAFDGDNVPEKNIALRKAADLIERLTREVKYWQKQAETAEAGRRQLWDERDWERTEIARLKRELEEARAALKPLADKSLWPDDCEGLSEEERQEWTNDEAVDDCWIKRGWIRAARAALATKEPGHE